MNKISIIIILIFFNNTTYSSTDYIYNNVNDIQIEWQDIIHEAKSQSNFDKLNTINHYFNTKIKYKSDISHWYLDDYWATPLESLITGYGDCEDYVIAKYFSLIEAGISKDSLRFVYAKSLTSNQAHMVLAYYKNKNSEPLLLDNMIKHITKLTSRPDLDLIYSFNDSGFWIERSNGNSLKVGSSQKIIMWTNFLAKMDAHGFKRMF